MGEDLSFFPKPYSDEDFRSLVYRYHKRSGNITFRQSKQELFNLNTHINRHLPRNLKNLVNKIPESSNDFVYNILQNHTFLPLVYPFISKDRIELILNEINYGRRNNPSNLASLLSNRSQNILSEDIRYCPSCLDDDTNRYGEVYIHRIHQLDFLDFCPTHKNKLITKCPVCLINLCNANNTILLSSHKCNNGHDLREKIISYQDEFKLTFLRNIEYILDKKMNIYKEEIIKKYMILIERKNYLISENTIRIDSLSDDLINHYGKDAINKIGLSINYIKSKYVFYGVFHKNSMQRYQLYILLMMFFKENTKKFFEERLGITRFNESGDFIIKRSGPWPCINVYCKNYRRNTILSYKRRVNRHSHNSLVIECECCGMRYSRVWDKDNKGELHNREKKIRFGWLFEESIFDDYTSGTQIKEIAIKARVSSKQVGTVIRNNIQGEIKKSTQENSALTEEEGNDLFRVSYGKEYKLNNKKSSLGKKIRNQFCWETVDKELVSKIEVIAEEIYQELPPIRIKKSQLINKLSSIDQNRLRRGKDFTREYLPKSEATIEKYIEPIEEYQKRKLDDKIKRLRKKGRKNITLSSLMSDSDFYKNCSNEVRDYIINRINHLNNI